MIRKHIWVWILCLAMAVCSLSACSPFGGKKSETAQNQTTQEAVSALADGQKPSVGATVSPEQDSQAEQSTPGQAETPESNEPKPTPEAPSEPTVSTSPQPEPELGSSDIIIQDNGDILLPEVP